MKRLFLLLVVSALFACLSVGVNAEASPVSLPAPALTFVTGLSGGSTRLGAYSRVPDSLVSLIRMTNSELRKTYGYADREAFILYDCSVDGGETWLCTEVSDAIDLTKGFAKAVGGDAVSDSEVFLLSREEDAAKLSPAVLETKNESGLKSTVFDYANHKLFLRAKYVVVMFSDEGGKNYFASEWSSEQEIKETPVGTYNPSEAVAPAIGGAKLVNDSHGEAVIRASVVFPASLSEFIVSIKSLALPELVPEFEISVDGGVWKALLQKDSGTSPYYCGERALSLGVIVLDGGESISLRVRFTFEGDFARGIAPLETPWSTGLAVVTDGWSPVVETATDTASPSDEGGVNPGVCYGVIAGLCAVVLVIAVYLFFRRYNATKAAK